jgi:hypothetical protein
MMKHGEGGGQRQVEPEVGVLAERLEGFLRAVGGRRESVGAKADPGQEGGQCEGMPGLGLERVEGPAEQCGAQVRKHGGWSWWNELPR